MTVDTQAEIVGRTDLVSLTLLAAIARTGSISGAGKAAGITQQAASQRLRQLEQRLGIPLLRRRARGSTLTEAGAVAAQWAADVVEAAQRFEAGVTALRSERRPANVAASLTIAEYLLPGWLLQSSGPRSSAGSIAVTAANSERVIELVTEGTHPLGFIESPHSVPHLTAETIARDELVVVVSPAHPWAARRSIPPATLAGTPLVTRERGSGTRFSAEETMTAAGFASAEPLLELPTTAAVRAVVASGTAPAILSTLAVRDDIDAGRLVKVRVSNIRFIRELRAIFSATDVLDPALRDLLDIAKRTHPL